MIKLSRIFLTILCLTTSTITLIEGTDTNTICTTVQGKVRGKEESDIDGNAFVSFVGIPFAKPPTGERRFKAPEEPDKWDGIFNATKEGPVCYSLQPGLNKKGFTFLPSGSEDCLVINVFTRKILQPNTDHLKPVMVYIYGGAYFTGSSKRYLYGPELLMIEDVVLVTFNYRLGALGFLNFQDPALASFGNAAMKDVLQALKWVQKNIRNFGGDPDMVTLFGESAGSASTHYAMLSPLAKGLFHRVIMQSGCALNPWAQGENDPRPLARVLGLQENDENKILKFLQDVPKSTILDGNKILEHEIDVSKKRPFCPAIERPSSEAFLSQDPKLTIKSGDYVQVPMLIGYNSNEALLAKGLEMFGVKMSLVERSIPHTLGYKLFDLKYNETAKKFYEYYKLGSEYPMPITNMTNMNKLISDVLFIRGIHETITGHVKSSQYPIYFYKMTLISNLNLAKKLLKLNKEEGVSHGDDLGYLFKTPLTRIDPDSVEDKSFRRFVRMWANFARTGNPTPDSGDNLLNVTWKPVSEQEMNYLEIGENLVLGTDPELDNMKFWDEIETR